MQRAMPRELTTNLQILFLGLAITGATIGAWCYFQHHFWTALKGPTEVTLADIARIKDPGELPSTWVKVQLDKVHQTEIVLEETYRGRSRIEEEYLLFQAGDRWMIARVSPGFDGNVLSGQIYHSDDQLASRTWGAIRDGYQQVHQGRLFPFEFDASHSYGGIWKMFAFVVATFAVAGLLVTFLGAGGIVYGFLPARTAASNADALAAAGAQASTAADETFARIMRGTGR